MSRFTLPRDIYFGENALEELKNLKGKKAVVVVGGGSMKKFGFLEKVESYLKEAGMEVKLLEGVEPDPSVETVMKGAQLMRDFEPDWIVAMGGGSPIDAAKAMWIFYEYPDFTFEQAVVPFGLPELRQKAKFVAISSTSGTGTEVTAFSVITDYKAKIKYPLADFNITPDVAIVDPALAQTMPPKLVSYTGMDAITHAIEAYVATARSSYSDPLAIKAVVMIKDYLVRSYNGDVEARAEMHDAQCLAGMAFSNALLGIVHSMAHKTGAVFHIPHGCANAIYLPYVIQFNRKTSEARFADIARAVGLPGSTNAMLTDSLIEMIRDLNKAMNIPLTLKDYGITEEDFNANLDSISKNALTDACTGSNPRPVDFEQMKKVFQCTFTGKDVNF
ncbi:iron-containing alcohol dehydrogenase [Clostridium sp. CX1]|uniref:Iron-containing alcohol dehydrogenase n=1 Tax=Clostridium tanneri TaxID=3037988 RepID=A0ABU4JXE5_9CLOT|nr:MULTISPECIES: iron-containing alcohol dehydrogenase [unclassified Clostridium]MCT8976734.1 iron-containing alcohol dehydrogenase [Clostridium sp. CX1]MDW8802832.1 iron-containing alcohol dehydrogenase [Clostridium sp. A1-XYC3]